MTKTAFIAIVGKPNVGKSSLMNKMLGQKIAIVSAKPQTTRTKIMGVLTNGDTQLVFTDTRRFTNELCESFVANEPLIKILFEGNRSSCFIDLFESGLKQLIKKVNPDYEESMERNVAITYLIYGGYYTYFKFADCGVKKVFDLIGKFSEEIVKLDKSGNENEAE